MTVLEARPVERTYEFLELDGDVREAIKEQYIYGDGWGPDSEDLTELFDNELEHRGLSGLTAQYSLSYCQGDGVAFDGRVDLDEVLDPEFAHIQVMLAEHRHGGVVDGVHVTWAVPLQDVRVHLTQRDSHYTHWNSFDVDICEALTEVCEIGKGCEDCGDWGTLTRHDDTGCEFLKPIDEALTQYFQDLSRKFEKLGYAEIDFYQSDEYFSDYFDERAAFLEDGTKVRLCRGCWLPSESEHLNQADEAVRLETFCTC